MMPRKYDWDRWFALGGFVLRRAKHYRCSQSTMSQSVRNQASSRGLSVSVVDGGDRLTVRVESRGPARRCHAAS